MTLVEFLLARIAESEEIARAVEETSKRRGTYHPASAPVAYDDWGDVLVAPRFLLAECDAKRRIVQRYSVPDPHDEPGCCDCDMLRILALPYVGHPDYQEEWRL